MLPPSILVRSLPLLALGLLQAGPISGAPGVPRSTAFASPLPIDRGAAALAQDLRRLSTRASLLTIVAHPDDEDGGMLAYESRHTGADTSLLTLTRGEGGQNLMSADFWDQLGQVRTQELLAADQFYGAHQYFARFGDFGFSKTLAEALKLWGHDRVLYDCVRVVRLTRPLVVNATFAGNVSDGHGQHQVSGLMAQEVYNLAGDPSVFPDQIKAGLLPWSPLKVYARVPFARVTDKGIYDYATGHWEPVRFQNYVTGQAMDGLPSTTLEVPEGTYEPLFGRSYLAVAREGLDQQKSQNGGVGQPGRGPFPSPYHLYASRLPGPLPTAEKDFFDGINTSLVGIANDVPAPERAAWRARLEPIQATVVEATATFHPEHPEQTAPALARGLGQTLALLAELGHSPLPAEARYNMRHELELKRDQFNQALLDALGLTLQANLTAGAPTDAPNQPTPLSATAGQPLFIALHLANQSTIPVHIDSAELTAPAGGSWQITPTAPISQAELAPASTRDLVFQTTVPADAPITQPYFARPTLEQAFYDILDPRYLNQPEMPYPLAGTVRLTFAGQPLTLHAVVQTTQSLLGLGPTLQPLILAPALSVAISPRAGVLPLTSRTLPVQVTVHSSQATAMTGTVRLDLPPAWAASPVSAPFSMGKAGEEQALRFQVTPSSVESRPYTITAVATSSNGQQFRQDVQTVGYKGLRPYPYAQPAAYRTTGTDVHVAPGLRVAYLMGTGDAVPDSLEDLGIHVTTLAPADLATKDLSAFDCIILGIRTYAAHPGLAEANPRLLDFVHRGGTVIVQYQTPEFDRNLGPYPLSLSRDPEKVVEEDGEVSLPLPSDPLLTWPNHITTIDFSGWVEERGHGFLRSWDAHYTAPVEVHDVGQEPQRGGLVYARSGQGIYIYLAFAFFREMPEGVPGSFRLMANLLSAGKNPALAATPPAQ